MAILESSFIVNSFYAIDADTKQVIPAEADGSIVLTQGQSVIFYDPFRDEPRRMDVFTVKAITEVRLAVNDNTRYPWVIPQGAMRGIERMPVYKITALTDCVLYYEGMCE